MATVIDRASAKIYTFPARGRFALGDHHDDSKLAANFLPPRVAKAVFGGAWYHEEAVLESERPRNS
jgi:Protein of unknown function (DUF2735)